MSKCRIKIHTLKVPNTFHALEEQRAVEYEEGASLLTLLRAEGFYLPAICGGSGSCGKCRVRVLRGTLPVTPADRRVFSEEELADGLRLACRAYPVGDLEIELAGQTEDEISVVDGYEGARAEACSLEVNSIELPKNGESVAYALFGERVAELSSRVLVQCSEIAEQGPAFAYSVLHAGEPAYAGAERPRLFGIGVDIGTTTLALELVDLENGNEVARRSAVNRQREFGADVISRMISAGEGHLGQMQERVREQIARAAADLCADAGIGAGQVVRFAVAGNTTMLHLLLGLSCKTLGVFPFTPVTLAPMTFSARELLGGVFDCPVNILPGISTYVGADITAGVYSTGLHKSKRPALLLDIGTNGEMALCEGGRLLCTSTAAGPAFEGGNIKWGTGSVPGAISSVRRQGDDFEAETIGGLPPVGICGSGVLDAVYQGYTAGLIDESGRMEKSLRKAGGITLGRTAEGRDIQLTQKDVRELQMGKSAIRSGIDILIEETGLGQEDIGTVYLAGGFGYKIDLDSAVGIGLLPVAFRGKTVAVGNTSLGGTVRSLLADAGGELNAIARDAKEFSLSANPRFNGLFMENMGFGGSL